MAINKLMQSNIYQAIGFFGSRNKILNNKQNAATLHGFAFHINIIWQL